MAKETPTIAATPRDRLGTRYAQRLRKTGRLPGVIYGHNVDPVAISVDEKEMLTALKRGAHVVNVAVSKHQPETCLVKDLQFGFLGDNVIHVDFARVDLNEEVEVSVQLRFLGHPEAAKKPGAVLSHPLSQLEVICKVSDIPSEIRVDISKLEEMLTVGEVQLPPGVRTEVDPETIVAQIGFVQEEVIAPAEAEEVGAAPAEPEVITEKKPEAEAEAPAEEK